ncbi:hypothetical protein GCM10010358_13140 [Streptomyces minutiscleroticus]|uniref:Uncharacterized protein n=1 Tax=Streptomyces minutiscleroticus TaxID=68238 RepID=A0A918KER0_9ACTN|nr:hypothetical protein GCM10010358_13140 [Streptomyces minutiscleroticus]
MCRPPVGEAAGSPPEVTERPVFHRRSRPGAGPGGVPHVLGALMPVASEAAGPADPWQPSL